ncbi:MAG: SdrD B-like domain-containing protein, partial [Candidatus Verstraetearchaeota archaeon]|nr:SdrD B-like domain-containing protein [Candidatus Verstraetearchaeota archaeon]
MPFTIEVCKFYDSDMDGIWDEGEPTIQGFKFQLLDTGGNVIDESFTDENGIVRFVCDVGEYTVREVLPSNCNWRNTTSREVSVTVGETLVEMYASAFTSGAIKTVNFDGYDPLSHPARLNPANVLGPFDAVQSSNTSPRNPNEYFFALNSREWVNYTFEQAFWNVDGKPDIEFAEVTWGDSWHTEAALVFLTNAYVRDSEGNVVPYELNDGGFGYFAGIVWNKIGISGLAPDEMEAEAQNYAISMGLSGGLFRDFSANTYTQNGNFGISQFYLPDEVVYATGIVLVDITEYSYKLGAFASTGSYENPGGTGSGYSVTLKETYGTPITSDDVIAVGGQDGNTDGFDLDAIRVYRPQALSIEFGNVCNPEKGYGGKTIGFWSNKNGQALITYEDVVALNALDLYKPTGWTYPKFSSDLSTAKAQIKNYLLSASAKEMKWMLSAQLIATVLNTRHGLSSSTIVYVGPS